MVYFLTKERKFRANNTKARVLYTCLPIEYLGSFLSCVKFGRTMSRDFEVTVTLRGV